MSVFVRCFSWQLVRCLCLWLSGVCVCGCQVLLLAVSQVSVSVVVRCCPSRALRAAAPAATAAPPASEQRAPRPSQPRRPRRREHVTRRAGSCCRPRKPAVVSASRQSPTTSRSISSPDSACCINTQVDIVIMTRRR